MIIFRYLTREVYATLSVVTGVLMLIFLSNQFIRYLSKAAAGKISSGVVLKIMALQIPYLLGLLLPVGLFIGILLVYGRLYADSEMTVMQACGLSKKRLLAYTLSFASLIVLIVGFLSFYVNPQILRAQEQLKSTSQAEVVMQTVMPGRFQVLNSGKQVFYIEDISRERDKAKNIFIARQLKDDKDQEVWGVTVAKSGYHMLDEETGYTYLVASEGNRFLGIPGNKDFEIYQFDKYGIRLDEQPRAMTKRHYEGYSNKELWTLRDADLHAMPELQWRLALPLSVILLASLAVPLSRVAPRKGRYAKLLPAIMIYIVYANLMFVAKDGMEQGGIMAILGLWWLHGALLLLTLLLFVDKHTWIALAHKFSKHKRQPCIS